MNTHCIFKRYVYGTSGTELPPPLVRTLKYIMYKGETETEDEFKERMKYMGLELRRYIDGLPAPTHGVRDGVDWEIIKRDDYLSIYQFKEKDFNGCL